MKTTRNTTGAAKGAKELREALKHAFPHIKFSVKSHTYAGGDSINVDWNFGPTDKQVSAIAKRWQGGNFNGMEDIYEYSEPEYHVTPEGLKELTTVKYLFTNRKYAYAAEKGTYDQSGYKDVAKGIAKLFNVEYNEIGDTNLFGTWEGVHNTASNYAYRLLEQTVFPSDNIQINDVKRLDVTAYCSHELSKAYEIEYTDLNPPKAPKVKNQTIVKAEPETAAESTATTEKQGKIQMIPYSEKSFVIFGDTKEIKETLKSLGGRFNSFLKHPETNDRLIGWIFPQTKAAAVIDTLF